MRIRRLAAATILATILITGTAPHANAAGSLSWWIADSSVNVFYSEPARSQKASLVMARNEYESFQVVLKSDAANTITSVTSSALTAGTNQIAASNVRTNYVEYVQLESNSNTAVGDGSEWRYPTMASNAPGWFPETLSNDASIGLQANTPRPIWVTVYAPAAAEPGQYRGKLTVNTTAGALTIPYSVEVGAATLPNPGKSAYTTLIHQQIVGAWYNTTTATNHASDPITAFYGYERWTPQWWTIVGKMADAMKETRVNGIFINSPALLLDGGTTLDPATGKYTFNWSRFDQYVQYYLDRDMVKVLEGVAIGHPDPTQNAGVNYLTYVLQRDGAGRLTTGLSPVDSATSRNWIDQYLPALFDHLRQKGWYKLWYQQVADEPDTANSQQQYAYFMSKLRAVAPDVPAGDASWSLGAHSYAVSQGANVVVPTVDNYEANRSSYDAMRSKGVRTWVYNMCCSGTHGYYAMNRFVDSKVYEGRVLPWASFKYGVTGYLHWAWNFWTPGIGSTKSFDTMTDPQYGVGGTANAFKGDQYIVHPDTKNTSIKATIRSQSQRDGAEDYELLALAAKVDPAAVKALIDRVAPSYNPADRPYDIGNLRAARDELVRLASGTALPGTASLNGDTMAELVQVAADGTTRAWLNGSPTVESSYTGSPLQIATGVTDPRRLRFADLDGDGRTERIMINSDGTIDAWWNASATVTKSFVGTPTRIASGFADPARVRFADLDGDGRAELINVETSGTIRAWWNATDTVAGSFVHGPLEVGWGFNDPGRVQFADLNGDKLADLINVNSNGTISGWRNQTATVANSFKDPSTVIASGFTDPTRVRFAQLDHDQRAELINIDSSGNIRAWWNASSTFAYIYPYDPQVIASGFSDPGRVLFG
ncbi:hypothetical protein GGQ54_001639 [Naumannella cuiyingiana]|uniref:DUF4091 domain-containing protein n=1 Tax=Naumannella cuiyingiana TaxID=1347891 RepID=A0A7Z0D949_9ACTN|nr:glycoside hydrolase domain-containing protein [Naumannella cuiyingiana]NYI71079.1 hypothetical protein [Naumannella cuiyingiana]